MFYHIHNSLTWLKAADMMSMTEWRKVKNRAEMMMDTYKRRDVTDSAFKILSKESFTACFV